MTAPTLAAALLDGLSLEEASDGVWGAPHLPHGRGVMFGGRWSDRQSLRRRPRSRPSGSSRSRQSSLAVSSSTRTSTSWATSVHEGRNLGTVAVRFVQRDRVAATMLVLMETPESDLVSHQVPKPPDVVPPDSARAVEHPLAAPETIIVDDVDISDPNQIGPPTLQLWVRFADAPADDPAMSRALLSHATDGWLIGTRHATARRRWAVDGTCFDLDRCREPRSELPRRAGRPRMVAHRP